MATLIETWLKTDLQHVVTVQELSGNLFSADSNANRIGVILMNKGRTVPITGGVSGYVIRPDDATLVISGSSEGNRAWIDLPASAYVHTGPIHIVIKNGNTTIGACSGYVRRSTTDTIVDPGHVVPSISDLLAEIENMRAATSAANTATANANSATSAANTAATNANSKASAANTAAENANSKAASANTAATNANTAATKINDMTIVAVQGDPSLPPSAVLELVNGHYRITFSNVKGLKGDTGDAFHIVKTYSSIAQMQADYSGTDTHIGDYVMVVNSVEDPDNAKVYIKGSSAWQFVVDMSGATGIKGDTGNGIASVSFSDYCLTLNFTDGTSYTTPSIRGEPGDATIDDTAGIGDDGYVWSADKVKKELDKKSNDFSPVIRNNFPEDIKVLENCAEGMGMKFEIQINPVQDLHGKDAPYPAGDIVNQFDPDSFSAYDISGNTRNGHEYTEPGTYAIAAYGSGDYCNIMARVKNSDDTWGSIYYIVSGSSASMGALLTIEEGQKLYVYDGAEHTSSVSQGLFNSWKIQVALSSTIPSKYYHYPNVCPISGFTGVDITRTGKNLFDQNATNTDNGYKANYYIGSSGSLASDSDLNVSEYISVLPNTQYEINPVSGNSVGLCFYDSLKQYISGINYGVTWGTYISKTFTTPPDTAYVRCSIPKTKANQLTLKVYNVYSITWESAGTVYGGTVTINEDGSGKLIVDRAKYTYTGEESFTYSASTHTYYESTPTAGCPGMKVKTYPEAFVGKSNKFAPYDGITAWSNITSGYYVGYIGTVAGVRFSINGGEVEDFASILAGTEVVYELATPVSYDLTPQQITSLFGTNTVWNSIGAFKCSYHLDPKIYVDDTAGIAGSIAVTDSTEASVKTMTDGADNLPMEVTVAINPIQDLHGQDSPYPAGAGKNLFDKDHTETKWVNAQNVITTSDLASTNTIDVASGTTLTISGNFDASTAVPQKLFIIAFLDSSNNILSRNIGSSGSSLTSTAPSDTTQAIVGVYGVDVETSAVQVEVGSSATAWSPYANVCPISGCDSVQITRTGVNVFDEEMESGYYNHSTGVKVAESSACRSKNYISVIPSTEYYVKNDDYAVQNSKFIKLFFYDRSFNFLESPSGSSTSRTFTTPANAYYMTFYVAETLAQYTGSLSINYPSYDTSYHAYVGKQYPISLPTTAYGGTLTINKDGSGRLYLDKAFDDLGNLSWLYDATYTRFYANIVGLKLMNTRTMELVCSMYRTISDGRAIGNVPNNSIYNGSNQNQIYIKTDQYTDPTAFKTAVTGQTVVYELATPVEINFTAKQIRSLLGTNNVWADSGNVLSVVYSADNKLYIDQQAKATQKLLELIVTANREDSMKATKAYTTGDLLIVDGTLYKATASISNGATLTVGTNVIATTVAAELAALA